jgi:Family of unknown function (DUF5994)
MSTTTTPRATVVASSPPSTPRLALAPARAGQAVLDGGWWPRTWDPVAELPGLILALSDQYGQIRHLMLNNGTWDSRFRRLAVGTAVIRTGWFTSLDPALVIATTDTGDQLDILVVPPHTAADAANRAMTAAADPADTRRAPAILATLTAPATASDPRDDADPNAVWDNEGGYIPTSRATDPHPQSPPPTRPDRRPRAYDAAARIVTQNTNTPPPTQ